MVISKRSQLVGGGDVINVKVRCLKRQTNHPNLLRKRFYAATCVSERKQSLLTQVQDRSLVRKTQTLV